MKKPGRTGFPSVDAKLEWICAEAREIQLPGVEGVTTHLRVWLELPTHIIVSTDMPGPDEALPPIDESLRKAAWQPEEGPPRLPKVIRTADTAAAERLRQIKGLKCEVLHGPTPEAESFLELFSQSMAEIDAREDYLAKGRIRPSVVSELFKAAKALYLLAPWRTMQDGDLIRVDIPALKVDEAYLSLIGLNGDSLGFLLFASFDDYVQFAETAISGVDEAGDEPPDLNSTWIALEFVSQDDISPKRRAQIETNGWILAGPDAFPDLLRFERGEPDEIRERDVQILSSCARALVTYLSKSGTPGFNLNALDRRSFVGPAGIEVFLEPAFEEEEEEEQEEEPDFLFPRLVPAATVKVGRNDPCPCGSGKKFKKCCLLDPSNDSPPRNSGGNVHEMDGRLVAQISDFAWRRHKVSEKHVSREFADPAMNTQLLYPYFAYCLEIADRRLLDLFLEEKGRNLPEREREWLEAQSRSWLSVWEIDSVEEGTGMTLLDLLTGERRAVLEKSGSKQAFRRTALLCRVVDFENSSVACGTHVRPLPPTEAAIVVNAIRKKLGVKQQTPVESLQRYEISRLMLAEWEREVAKLHERSSRRPILKNTDGHSLLHTVDRFTFEPSNLNEITSRLSRMEQVSIPDPDETPREFVLERVNPPGSALPSTTIGTIRIEGTTLVAETNSVERADALRKKIENACGKLLKPSLREHVDVWPKEGSAGGSSRPTHEADTPIPPEVRSEIRNFKERFYSTWLDQPVPALDGKTPRAAAKTKKGRSQLEVLLKDLEYTEARSNPEDPFDVSTLRVKLGLSDPNK
jgi:hypothetical protein